MTFEEAMVLTRTINCDGVYSDPELHALYHAAYNAPPVGVFVEIGCEYGRSTSLVAQIAKERGQELILIDPYVKHFSGAPAGPVAAKMIETLVDLEVKFTFYRHHSFGVDIFRPIAFLHIDGNHSEAFLANDILHFCGNIVDGGYVAFHDYGRDEPYTREVKETVDCFISKRSIFKPAFLEGTCIAFRKEGAYADYYTKGRP